MSQIDNELAMKDEPVMRSGNEPPLDEHQKLYGFGGWLYFVVIGLLLTFGNSLYYLLTTLLPIYKDGLISDLQSENGNYLVLIIYETVTYLFYVLFPLYVGYLGFKKMKRVRTMIICFYLLNFAFNVGYYFVANSIEELASPDFIGEQGRNIVKSLITCIVWIPYFINSKRVKCTYVN
ncbi:hypothetical protein A8709_21760 [Paenibacillus pectinilyticus]|uniref:DUF2569 domain-containing protein n=2 Tax=Paenibacillus pectinilyticus TaxID=512399 RepID=A0A1C0ZXX2_9BACL|nr:hypothetical protein A8709_21760 [Paenibacillus pectinilyticus]